MSPRCATISADEGHVLNGRDFRVRSCRPRPPRERHLQRQPRADPNLDVHNYVGGKITESTGQSLGRGKLKVLNSASTAAASCQCRGSHGAPTPRATRFKERSTDAALLGRKIRVTSCRPSCALAWRCGHWRFGYTREAPRLVDGRMRDFDYRVLNYLVQGANADATKRAILRMVNHRTKVPVRRAGLRRDRHLPRPSSARWSAESDGEAGDGERGVESAALDRPGAGSGVGAR